MAASSARGPDVQQQRLAERLRAMLPAGQDVREVRMFGGLSFMLEGRMIVAAGRDGDLLVRIDPERSDELLAVEAARPAAMGPGREMGPGWVMVGGASSSSDDQLGFWLDVALQFHAAST